MPNTETLFPGFREHKAGPIFARVGGSGSPLLLLHGYPQTGAMWHKIAPGLAEDHTVVVADLLGYGASDSPPGDGGGEAYSKARHGELHGRADGRFGLRHVLSSLDTIAAGASLTASRSTIPSESSGSHCSTSCPPPSSSSRWASPAVWADSTGTSSPNPRRCPRR